MSDLFSLPHEWGAWKIERLIGEGSFAKVYLVSRKEYDKVYYAAVKYISIPKNKNEVEDAYTEGFAVDEGSVGSYYDEIMRDILNEINTNYELKGNTNIVCYEDHLVKKNENGYGYKIYIRMEFLRSLSEIIRQNGGLSERETVKLGIDMCSALEVLEARNIIHRDIKPANIFVNNMGVYKLGDFGIAKTLDRTINSVSIKGTISYMPPEIMHGVSVDKTADIYSLGLVLYRLLNNNRPPFAPQKSGPITHDENNTASAKRMAGEPLPYPSNCSDETLAKIVLTACQYKPENRWQSPTAMKRALTGVLEEMDNNQQTFAIKENIYNTNRNNYSYQNSVNNVNQKKSKTGIIIGSVAGAAALISVIVVVLFFYPGLLTNSFVKNGNEFSLTDNSVNAYEKYESEGNNDKEKNTQATEDLSVKKDTVPDVLDEEIDDAKKKLTDNDFLYDISYDYSDTVEEGCVISQSPKGGKEAYTGTRVKLVVSKGPEMKPSPEYYSQKIELKTEGTYATMELFTWNGQKWESQFYTSNVRIGENGAGYNYGEGKKITPKGTFNLGFCYGLTRPDTGLEFKALTPSSVFVDDPSSPYYNMLVDKSLVADGTSYENTYNQFAVNNYYSTCIFIEHNGDGETTGTAVPYMGSVITICGKNGSLNSTFGCVDISSSDMETLLSYLDESLSPVIIIS